MNLKSFFYYKNKHETKQRNEMMRGVKKKRLDKGVNNCYNLHNIQCSILIYPTSETLSKKKWLLTLFNVKTFAMNTSKET